MKIQEIVSDVRGRVEDAGKQYQGAFMAYVDAQKKALNVVTKNSQTLAGTEIGAAKNVFAAARASFDKARKDGVRKVASEPQAYVPNGRDQIVSAYKDTIDLLVKTGNELTDIVSNGYKSVLGKLNGKPVQKKAPARKAATKRASTKNSASANTSTSSAKPAARKATAKRKLATAKAASSAKATGAAKTGTASAASKSGKTSTAKTGNTTTTADPSQTQ